MATKNANIVNLNEASNIMEKEILVLSHLNITKVSPAIGGLVGLCTRLGTVITIKISHRTTLCMQDYIKQSQQTLSSTKIKETHSDAQMILAVQSTMLANGEPQETIDAYTDGIIRMREEIAASLNKKSFNRLLQSFL